MLKQVIGTEAAVECNKCNERTVHDVKDIRLPFIPEFGEYANLSLQCPNCGAVEIFNVNIPENEADDLIPLELLPIEEDIQRYYVRLLMRLVRADFVTNSIDTAL